MRPYRRMLVYNRQTNRGGGGAPSIPDIADYAGVIFLDQFTGVLAAGNVDGTLSSDGNAKRVVTDTTSKLSINNLLDINANASNDPMIQYTQPDDSLFDNELGYGLIAIGAETAAVKLSLAAVVRSQLTIGGASQDGPKFNWNALTPGSLKLEQGGQPYSFVFAKPPTTGPYTFLGINRSQPKDDTSTGGGTIFLQHVTGQQWKIVSPSTSMMNKANWVAEIRQSSNADATFDGFGIVDLAADGSVAEDFSALTDSLSTPSTNTNFTITPGGTHTRWSFTWHNTDGALYAVCRYGSGISTSILLQVNATSGTAYFKVYNSTVWSQSGYFVDGVSYVVDFVDEGSTVALYINGVNVHTATSVAVGTETVGRIVHNPTTNDMEIRSHPYPALGGTAIAATGRVMNPVDYNIATYPCNCSADGAVIIGRNFHFISSDFNRIIHDTNGVDLQLRFNAATPLIRFYEGDTIRATASSPAIADGDDVMLVVDGSTGTCFVNGTQMVTYGSFAVSTSSPVQVGTFVDSADGSWPESLEIWPLYVTLPFTLE